MFIKKVSQPLYRLSGSIFPDHHELRHHGLALFNITREYTFYQGIVFAVGAGGGFTWRSCYGGIREELSWPTFRNRCAACRSRCWLPDTGSAFSGFAG